MTSVIKFDKEKYRQILKSQGIAAALTALHKDKNEWEFVTFEGDKGYQRGMWDDLQEVRDFSIELWDLSSRQPA